MAFEEKITALFRMTDEVWARHANPWSVWTRYTSFPVLILSIWSRVWIGWWALVPLFFSVLWIWINPRLFSKPSSTDHWSSKSVMGERVWINRKKIPIPEHHGPILTFLNVTSTVGSLICIWGLIKLSVLLTVFGTVVVVLGKSWFLDRMVWLYGEMMDADPEYRSWLY